MSPIPRVLSTIRAHDVRALLMGGQACVLYGAAEFSRDADFAVLASSDNLDRLRSALDELRAEVIAVPPFEPRYLAKGHAVHFRCRHPEAERFRVDVMARMRGVDPFPVLWERRTTWELPGGLTIETLSLPDLVASKKTQRDKDWPMLRRLVEASYAAAFGSPTAEQVDFWLRELRTRALLAEAARRFPEEARSIAPTRPALAAAITGDEAGVVEALAGEEAREREADRRYWEPLRKELERLRHGRE
ncbi:MAG TPA: nucleotidyl transferase AbiEii/AbiGii toxin family protein [Candidatus Limnocylindrales bacterium]|nr:nucleotidyl transferase AbiEii/AbiGii toxin family protein [Candidatus Limnocylindrales bacterium]